MNCYTIFTDSKVSKRSTYLLLISYGSELRLVDHLISQFHLRPYGVGYRLCFILISYKTFLSGYIPSFLGSNIKVVDWLPQNDLLVTRTSKLL